MPGFGHGSFGGDPFGAWGWSRTVLYESIPTVYRDAQSEAGEYLRKFTAGQQPEFDRIKTSIARYDSIRDPFAARTGTSEAEFLVLGKEIVPTLVAEQAGVLGRCTSLGIFESQDRAVLFRPSDVGKQLYVRRSNVAANNQQNFTITSILSPTTVFVDPPLRPDAGPIRWELRALDALPTGQVQVEVRGGDIRRVTPGWALSDGKGEYEVVTRQMFYLPVGTTQLLTEREGSGSLGFTAEGISALTGAYSFQQQDVGKFVLLDSMNPVNYGLREIVAVEAGSALFGMLVVAGQSGNPQGTLRYSYTAQTDRPLVVEQLHELLPSLPLLVTLDTTPSEYRIRVRLQTDSNSAVITTPSQVIAAIAADTLLAPLILVGRPPGVPLAETPVGELNATAIKPGYTAAETDLYWALRPFPRMVLRGALPLGVIDTDGADLRILDVSDPLYPPTLVLPPNTTLVYSFSGPFLSGDVGKLLTIRGSSVGNDGVYEIYQYVSPNLVIVSAALVVPDPTPAMYFARRSNPQFVPDPTRLNPQSEEVRASAEALLDLLALDFGMEVDTQQTDLRQRSSVRQVSQLSALKGTLQAVDGAAVLSGFQQKLRQLYTIPPLPNMDPSLTLYFVGLEGRYYNASAITVSGGTTTLTTSTAAFVASDVGKILRVCSTVATNNGYFIVAAVTDAFTVELTTPSIGANLDAAVTPVTQVGTIPFVVGKVYSEEPFAYPLIDDINFDVLSAMYDLAGYTFADRPGIDRPCLLQEIKVGYDPDGYAKATLDCQTVFGDYWGVLEAHVAGAGGNAVQFDIVLGGPPFQFTVLGNTVTAQCIAGATYPAQIDAVLAGLTVTNLTYSLGSSGDITVTCFTPHGLPTTGFTVVEISGITTPTEANGTWKAQYASPTTFTLWTNTAVPTPVFGTSPYLGGGVVRHAAVAALMRLKTSSVSRGYNTPVSLPFPSGPENFSGGLGLTPPEVVTLDPTPGTGFLNITAVSTVGLTHTVTVVGADMEAVASRYWKFYDLALGREYFLDTTPVLQASPPAAPNTYLVQTTAAEAPSLGPTYFEYICTPAYSCDACASNRVAVDVVADTVLDEGAVALESAFERVQRQLRDVMPANAQQSYRLRQYFNTPALFAATPPATTWEGRPITTFRMVWTDYAKATYLPGSPPTFTSFKVGLGGYTPEGGIRIPDPSLTDLDIIQNYAARYQADYPPLTYPIRYFSKSLSGFTTTSVVTGGTQVEAVCFLDFPEFNSTGSDYPQIREIGLFDGPNMVAYATFGGVQKTELVTVALVAELPL